MAEQHSELRSAIDEAKWYLSEAAGRDVGIEAASLRFMEEHLDGFAHQFRMRFCGERCPGRQTCSLAQWVHRLTGSARGVPVHDQAPEPTPAE